MPPESVYIAVQEMRRALEQGRLEGCPMDLSMYVGIEIKIIMLKHLGVEPGLKMEGH